MPIFLRKLNFIHLYLWRVDFLTLSVFSISINLSVSNTECVQYVIPSQKKHVKLDLETRFQGIRQFSCKKKPRGQMSAIWYPPQICPSLVAIWRFRGDVKKGPPLETMNITRNVMEIKHTEAAPALRVEEFGGKIPRNFQISTSIELFWFVFHGFGRRRSPEKF